MTETAGARILRLFDRNAPQMTRAELIALEIAVREQMAELTFETYSDTDQLYIKAADGKAEDGEIEVDMCTTVVSESTDGGAYVQAWLWVSDEEAELEVYKDKESEDDDE